MGKTMKVGDKLFPVSGEQLDEYIDKIKQLEDERDKLLATAIVIEQERDEAREAARRILGKMDGVDVATPILDYREQWPWLEENE